MVTLSVAEANIPNTINILPDMVLKHKTNHALHDFIP